MLTITFYGHACFALTDGETKLLIDPFFTGNGLAPIKAEEAETDYILVTHGHGDHTGDAASIAERTGATIITTVDVGTALFGNCRNLICGNIGGKIQLPFGSIQYVPAIHGSGVPGGVACGFVIRMDGKTVYHMGDTSLTKDFELLADSASEAFMPLSYGGGITNIEQIRKLLYDIEFPLVITLDSIERCGMNLGEAAATVVLSSEPAEGKCWRSAGSVPNRSSASVRSRKRNRAT